MTLEAGRGPSEYLKLVQVPQKCSPWSCPVEAEKHSIKTCFSYRLQNTNPHLVPGN